MGGGITCCYYFHLFVCLSDCFLPHHQTVSSTTAEATSIVVPTQGPGKEKRGTSRSCLRGQQLSRRLEDALGIFCSAPSHLSEQKAEVGKGLSLSPSETPISGSALPRQHLTPPRRETEVQAIKLPKVRAGTCLEAPENGFTSLHLLFLICETWH